VARIARGARKILFTESETNSGLLCDYGAESAIKTVGGLEPKWVVSMKVYWEKFDRDRDVMKKEGESMLGNCQLTHNSFIPINLPKQLSMNAAKL